MRRWPRRSAGSFPSAHDRRWLLEKRKAQHLVTVEMLLKLPHRVGRRKTDNAALFAANTLPVVNAIRATGVTDLRGIAAALNARGVRTPRDGRWHVSNVKNPIDRVF